MYTFKPSASETVLFFASAYLVEWCVAFLLFFERFERIFVFCVFEAADFLLAEIVFDGLAAAIRELNWFGIPEDWSLIYFYGLYVIAEPDVVVASEADADIFHELIIIWI